MTTRYYLNGKFIAQRATGVQRVATCLLHALDELQRGLPGKWVVLCPPSAELPKLSHMEALHVGRFRWPLHLWEQIELPLAARDGVLVNLAGSAPFFARRQIATIHDAAVFDCPGAYTRAFALWYRCLFRHLARSAQQLLTVSDFSRRRLARCLHVEPSDIAVLLNGSDHFDAVISDGSALATYDLAATRYFLAVASANPTKNLDALLNAFARLAADAAVRLVIVGGRNDRVFKRQTRFADPFGVTRLGPVSDQTLKALYADAVALVFPSLYEGFGLPPLEAMACGCPVVASTAASIPEVCGAAALYVDPGSERAITDAMERLLGDDVLRQQLREAGRAQAALFSWSDSAARLLASLPTRSAA